MRITFCLSSLSFLLHSTHQTPSPGMCMRMGRSRTQVPTLGSVYGPPSPGRPAGLGAATYLLERQVLWTRRYRIALQGSAGDHGRPAYTPTLEENLFEPLSQE